MRGTRDQCFAAKRLQEILGPQDSPWALEMDMDDMFWELSVEETKKAPKWAFRVVSGKKTFWACIHKGGLRELDRVGVGSADNFVSTSEKAITEYVDFDVRDNNLFRVGPLILEQGLRGVPIGGFLSAQLSEIWAIWREELYALGPEKEATAAKVTEELRSAYPNTRVNVTLTGAMDFTLAPDTLRTMSIVSKMCRAVNIAEVTPNRVEGEGFQGWWNPVDRMLGCLEFAGQSVVLANTVPWDGSVGGRVDAIMKYTEPANKLLVRNFLAHVTPLKAVVAECTKSATQPHSKYQNQLEGRSNPGAGVMLISRYRDNIYQLLLNVQSELIEQVKTFVSLFLHKIYNLKLKWEPHGEVAVWGEGELRTTR